VGTFEYLSRSPAPENIAHLLLSHRLHECRGVPGDPVVMSFLSSV
jgi:hypothetical protein